MIETQHKREKEIRLDESWIERLKTSFSSEYMIKLRRFLIQEKELGKRIFPPGRDIFNALNSTKFNDAKVVILGQDPYHGFGQAHGLCFSVRENIAIPPSLQNIYKELHDDIGFISPGHGCLKFWAEQGVLMLNSVLTVEAGKAASHQGKGWERFTDSIIEALNDGRDGVVFLLWGSYAQRKGSMIKKEKHLVLESPHPSPLSAYRGFFGNRHFSKTNNYLIARGERPINWQLPIYSLRR